VEFADRDRAVGQVVESGERGALRPVVVYGLGVVAKLF
jgi:hypothetical protein